MVALAVVGNLFTFSAKSLIHCFSNHSLFVNMKFAPNEQTKQRPSTKEQKSKLNTLPLCNYFFQECIDLHSLTDDRKRDSSHGTDKTQQSYAQVYSHHCEEIVNSAFYTSVTPPKSHKSQTWKSYWPFFSNQPAPFSLFQTLLKKKENQQS